MMKTLDLVLKHHWYDMIASGEKKEEYREIKRYYISRLLMAAQLCKGEVVWKNLTPFLSRYYDNNKSELKQYLGFSLIFKNFSSVTFHRGYTNTTMTFKIEDMKIGIGNPNWGAPNEEVFIIKLGERI